MGSYYIIFSIILLLQLFRGHSDKDYRLRCMLSFAVLFVWIGFKSYDNDYPNYLAFYEVAKQNGIASALDFNDHMEYGWAVINSYFPSFRLLILVQTFMFCFAYATNMHKYISREYAIAFIILLFTSGDKSIGFMTSGMRNSIVISALILSTPLVLKGRWVYLAIISILASTIHTSAIIFLPIAYILGFVAHKGEMSKIELYIWLVLFVILLVFPVGDLLMPFSYTLADSSLERYEHILLEDHQMAKSRAAIASIGIIGALLYYLKFYAKELHERYIIRVALLFGYGYLLGTFNQRVSQYYMFFIILATMFFFSNKQINSKYRYGFYVFVLAICYYALFVVDLPNSYSFFKLFKSFI